MNCLLLQAYRNLTKRVSIFQFKVFYMDVNIYCYCHEHTRTKLEYYNAKIVISIYKQNLANHIIWNWLCWAKMDPIPTSFSV